MPNDHLVRLTDAYCLALCKFKFLVIGLGRPYFSQSQQSVDSSGIQAPSIVPPGSGLVARIRNFTTVAKVRAEDTGGVYSVLEHTLAPGYVAMPVHRHVREVKTVYVIAGTATMLIGKRVVVASSGTTVHLPAGTPHTFWNARPEAMMERDGKGPGDGLRLLAVFAPGGLERYYAEVAALVPTGGTPDVPSILEVSAAHGVEVEMLSLLDIIERHKVELA